MPHRRGWLRRRILGGDRLKSIYPRALLQLPLAAPSGGLPGLYPGVRYHNNRRHSCRDPHNQAGLCQDNRNDCGKKERGIGTVFGNKIGIYTVIIW